MSEKVARLTTTSPIRIGDCVKITGVRYLGDKGLDGCLVTYAAPAVITFPSRCKWSRRGRVYRWLAPLSYSFEATWASVDWSRATV
jgi:hypothetical protein